MDVRHWRKTRQIEGTLLWVYVIGCLVVIGTLMASGPVVWSVMVRRRLYGEFTKSNLALQTAG